MKAIGKNVIVSKQEPAQTTAGGIIYTDNSKATIAVAVAIGNEVTSINTGDSLIINWSAANPIKLNDVTHYIVNIDHVFAVV